ELERLLLGPGRLPQELGLEFPDGPVSISLGDSAEFSNREAQRHLDWDVTRATAPTPRHEAYRLLHKRLRLLGRADRDRVLGELAAMASADQSPRADRRLLDEHALRTLDRSPCGRVGCHTVSHPVLSRVSLSEAREEIAQAKGRLESILGREVLDFSYPYGSSLDYDKGTQDILKELGFRTACTTVRGLVRTGRELLALPRVGVRDLAEEDFRLLLEAELAGAGG
ncbi:MAG: polysaccharide deacetylase family protein, partial [Humidesulfovibrio sp.]|nr:polysaccharide deacetylase family protein [Humidesulfovibrio sp.]